MLTLNRLITTARTFAKDEAGNFALMFAAASTALMLTAGVAVDYTRLVSTKSQLRAALDSALLSTAQDLAKGTITKAAAESRAKLFFEANLASSRFPAGSAQIVDFKVDPSDSSITAGAKSDVKMTFPVFGMKKSATVATKAGAGFSERKIEVSMVLDVTGSMEQDDKIGDLKLAAKTGVSEFLANGAGNTRVAIVPYSFGVNAGSLASTVANEGGGVAADTCASERRGPEMFTDASPDVAKVTRANRINYWADDDDNGTFEIRPNGYLFDLPMDNKSHGGLYGADCPETPVQPLTKDAAVLNKVIDDLAPIGGTAGQMGVQWGWYMVSPEWKSVLPATSKPEAYGKANVEKYLILMTDGMFNSEASGLSSGDVGTFDGISQLSGRLAMTYCDAIKDKKVKIFTIGFRLKDIGNADQQAEATKMLKDCATTPAEGQQTFYDAENGAELTAAFKEIARRVEVVRLTN